MHFALFYEVVEDYLEKRTPFREKHLAHATRALERGELVLAGAFAEPADGALLIFKGDSPATAERFAAEDPYVLQGLVTRWWVRKWTTVIGNDASVKV
jgi:uncharacterized protein YciI